MKFFYDSLLFFLVATLWSSHSFAQQSLSTSQPSLSSRQFHLNSDFSMSGFGYKEFQDESQLVVLTAHPKASYDFTKDFGVSGDVRINMVTGRAQSRFQNPNWNLINVVEMQAYYRPTTFFDLSVGAINQNHFNNDMFIAYRGFPGVLLKSGFETKNLKFRPKFQYAIPTSTSFESDRTQAEALPTLATYGAEAGWQPLTWLGFDANVSHFQFQNLPAVVAFDSSRLGNSVLGTDTSDAKFRYQFQGITQAYGINLKYTDSLSQKFTIGMVDNTSAPSDRQRSQWLGSGVTLDFEDVTVVPEFASFYAESDSTPSLYSSFYLGRNNRQGEYYALKLNFKKLGFAINANFVNARLLEHRPLQADLQIFDLSLEFNNVAL